VHNFQTDAHREGILDFACPVKRQETAEHPERWTMTVNNELMDQLRPDYKTPEDLIGQNGLLKQLTSRLIECALGAAMTEHLGHAQDASLAKPSGNARNGKKPKHPEWRLWRVARRHPRDPHASFKSQIVPKQHRGPCRFVLCIDQLMKQSPASVTLSGLCIGGATQSRTGLDGFAIRCITDLLSRQIHMFDKKGKLLLPFLLKDVGTSFCVWSGKRGSNSRPQPWQGCALPTELFPHLEDQIIHR
jgi:hypothetical protein